MSRGLVPVLVVILIGSTAMAQKAGLQDRAGFKDPGLFTRMPGYYLSGPSSLKETQYDFYEFWVKESNRDRRERVEGHKVVYYSYFDTSVGKSHPSGLQIERNYQEAAVKIGGQVFYDGRDAYNTTTLRITRDGQETWAEIKSNGDGLAYYLTLVERKAMTQDVVASADSLRSGLEASGPMLKCRASSSTSGKPTSSPSRSLHCSRSL